MSMIRIDIPLVGFITLELYPSSKKACVHYNVARGFGLAAHYLGEELIRERGYEPEIAPHLSRFAQRMWAKHRPEVIATHHNGYSSAAFESLLGLRETVLKPSFESHPHQTINIRGTA